MPLREQDPPFAIQIELTEGCNLRCTFCGLQGIREAGPDKQYKFMTPQIISEVGRVGQLWNARLELAMHGEPTMHPDFTGMVKHLRTAAPDCQIMITTNGGGLLKDPVERVVALFGAGLDVLALDEYEGIKIGSKVRAVQKEIEIIGKSAGMPIHFHNYPTNPDASPHRRHPKKALPLVVYIVDPSVQASARVPHLNNHAGSAFPKNDTQQGKRCAKPFREVSVRWNGNVAICCNDWRGEYKCGNVMETPLETMWSNAAFDAARRRLMQGKRDFGPCAGCDATSTRVGLLPDKLGKEKMPAPTAASQRALNEALAGQSYARPVLRPWEKN